MPWTQGLMICALHCKHGGDLEIKWLKQARQLTMAPPFTGPPSLVVFTLEEALARQWELLQALNVIAHRERRAASKLQQLSRRIRNRP